MDDVEVRNLYVHATSSEGLHPSAAGCVLGAPSLHQGPLGGARWSSGASVGRRGVRLNTLKGPGGAGGYSVQPSLAGPCGPLLKGSCGFARPLF